MGRQRQRREPKQRLPSQGGLRAAFRPGFGPRGALELPVCGRQRKQHHPHAVAEGWSRQVAGWGGERPAGGCTVNEESMNYWRKQLHLPFIIFFHLLDTLFEYIYFHFNGLVCNKQLQHP